MHAKTLALQLCLARVAHALRTPLSAVAASGENCPLVLRAFRTSIACMDVLERNTALQVRLVDVLDHDGQDGQVKLFGAASRYCTMPTTAWAQTRS
jgi:hypothetical protein